MILSHYRAGTGALLISTNEERRCLRDIIAELPATAQIGVIAAPSGDLKDARTGRAVNDVKGLIGAYLWASGGPGRVIVVWDFHPIINNAGSWRALADAIPALRSPKGAKDSDPASLAVFIAPSWTLDATNPLKSALPKLDYAPPDRAAIARTAGKLRKLDKSNAEQVVDALCGLSADAAEQAAAEVLARTGGTWDCDALRDARRQVLRDGGLELRQPIKMADYGGMQRLKNDFTTRVVPWLRDDTLSVRRMIWAGISGTGKTFGAQLLAGLLGCEVVVMSLCKLKGGIVGQSLHPDEEIYVCKSRTGRDFRRMTMAEFHDLFTSGDQEWYTPTYTDFGGGELRPVLNSFKHVRQEKFLKLTTRSGRSVIVTEGHSVFKQHRIKLACHHSKVAIETMSNEERQEVGREVGRYKDEPIFVDARAGDLKIGDKIAVARRFSATASYSTTSIKRGNCELHIDEETAQFFGLWIADGSWCDQAARITVADKDVETVPFLEKSFGKDSFSVAAKYADEKAFNVIMKRNHWINDAMHIAGIRGRSRTKRIPAWLFGCSQRVIGAFLRGYFSGDGSFSGHVVEASTMSRDLAKDLLSLLARVGIFARMRSRMIGKRSFTSPKVHSRPGYLTPEGRQYRITISKLGEVALFAQKVGFMQAYKNDAVAKSLIGKKQNKYWEGRVFRSIFWDEVQSIEEVDGPGHCYDISVEGTERFVCGGVVVHNSEQNLVRAFKTINAIGAQSPLVVVIDEVDSIAKSGLDGGTSSGMWAILGEHLQYDKSQTIYIGTTNRYDLLDTALTQRFGRGYFFDLCSAVERKAICDIHYRRCGAKDPMQAAGITADLTEGFSARELAEGICPDVVASIGRDAAGDLASIRAIVSQYTPTSISQADQLAAVRKSASALRRANDCETTEAGEQFRRIVSEN